MAYNVDVVNNGLSDNVKVLESIATDKALVDKTLNLDSNVGDVGMSIDYSRNSLASQLQTDHPLLTWLMGTRMSRELRAASRRGLAQVYKDTETEDWMLMLPFQVYTLPPKDTSGACCWVPFDIAKCAGNVPLKLLCLKDCYSLLDRLVNQNRRAGSNDLTNYFLREGETVYAARVRMARLTMAYMTARNVILGVLDAGTETLKPFHGLVQVLEDPAVIDISGSSILSAFASLACRIGVLGGSSNYVFATHPLVYEAIKWAAAPDIYNRMPANWSRNANGDTFFMGHRFIADKVVPIDLDNGRGEIWMLNGDHVGVYLATDLMPTASFISDQFTGTDNPADGCASECTYYWNYGAVATDNPNYLAVISSIPISSNCTESLAGLDDLIAPNTPSPRV